MPDSANTHTPRENVPDEKYKTLRMEYRVAFQFFESNFKQAWQNFSIATTLSLTGLAFVAQLKASVSPNTVTWPISLMIGLAMIIMLYGWLALARRGWSYASLHLHRMKEIEAELGHMYLLRENAWLRRPLNASQLEQLGDEEANKYKSLLEQFPSFPRFRWRTQNLASVIMGALIVIWILYIAADCLSLI